MSGRSAVIRHFARLVAIVARRDYVRTVRRRGFIFGTLLLPIGIGGLLSLSSLSTGSTLGQGGSSGPVQLLIVNESNLSIQSGGGPGGTVELLSRAAAGDGPVDATLKAIKKLTKTKAKLLQYNVGSITGGTDALGEVTVRVAEGNHIVVGKGSSTDIIEASAKGGGLDAIQRQSNQQTLLVALLRNALLSDGQIPAAIAARIQLPAVISAVDLNGQPVTSGSILASFLLPYAFTLLFVMSIFITSGYLLQSVTEEKENRVVEIVLSSVPALPLMGGKILGLGAAGLTQVVIWVATALIALPLLDGMVPAMSALGVNEPRRRVWSASGGWGPG